MIMLHVGSGVADPLHPSLLLVGITVVRLHILIDTRSPCSSRKFSSITNCPIEGLKKLCYFTPSAGYISLCRGTDPQHSAHQLPTAAFPRELVYFPELRAFPSESHRGMHSGSGDPLLRSDM